MRISGEQTIGCASDWLVIHFRAPGELQVQRVALGWLERGFVEWTCPCLDGAGKLPQEAALLWDMVDSGLEVQPSFLRAMNWLDAVCFGAPTLGDVRRACESNPDYGLFCSFESDLALDDVVVLMPEEMESSDAVAEVP